ncbi:hypothetical protein [Photobacterium leiognathi]|uniref:Uncharacterized protein n=1 Tax=Photobacterium leiognathi subsp. mandapamensis TaxID=48408 RepID=A0A2T3KZD3_PHOLD|nr:hypothetical protein [Photobacterium leiognathi]PSV13473.1 hypothetical protein C0W93_00580 [Photobacterium leiognathi subsp. mandapamensis]
MESEYALKNLVPKLDDHNVAQIDNFLEKIECPESFRGLYYVVSYLENISITHHEKFKEIFGIKGEVLGCFADINPDKWQIFSLDRLAKGWMSERPIYALIITLSKLDNDFFNKAALTFLKHFFSNEAKIKNVGREEVSVRAFRLFITDRNADQSILDGDNSLLIAEQLQHYRNKLKGDKPRNHTLEGYVRELEHFYRLDWKPKLNFQRIHKTKLRGSYWRNKVDRIEGSEDLYTFTLRNQQINQFHVEGGLDSSEDYPSLTIVRHLPENKVKPKHERPDISIIRDGHKDRNRKIAIQKEVKKSHNLSACSSNILQPHELFYLTESLLQQRKKDILKTPVNVVQRVIFLTLFLGIDIDLIKTLKRIEREDSEGNGIFCDTDNWYLKFNISPTVKMGKHRTNSRLLKTKPYTTILLPDFFVTFLNLKDLAIGDKLLPLKGSAAVKDAIKQYLKTLNRRYHIQISYKSIRYYLTNKIKSESKIDPVIMECLSGKSNYYTRSMRHYSWRDDTENTQEVYKLWNAVRKDIENFQPSNLIPPLNYSQPQRDRCDKGIGSQFTPTKESIVLLVEYLIEQLEFSNTFDTIKSIENLKNYHNNYTLYTAYMLLNSTGYRAVHNPLPSLSLFLPNKSALCISDKDAQKSFSHFRIVAVPEILKQQLINYSEHLNSMGNLLSGLYLSDSQSMHWHTSLNPLIESHSKVEKLEWFLSEKHSRGNEGVFKFFDPNTHVTTNMSPKILSELIPESMRLPINFGRHYIRRYLAKLNVDIELINFQLGHWVNGELPLSNLSTFEHSKAIEELKTHLDPMLEELGWKVIRSNLTMRRK